MPCEGILLLKSVNYCSGAHVCPWPAKCERESTVSRSPVWCSLTPSASALCSAPGRRSLGRGVPRSTQVNHLLYEPGIAAAALNVAFLHLGLRRFLWFFSYSLLSSGICFTTASWACALILHTCWAFLLLLCLSCTRSRAQRSRPAPCAPLIYFFGLSPGGLGSGKIGMQIWGSRGTHRKDKKKNARKAEQPVDAVPVSPTCSLLTPLLGICLCWNSKGSEEDEVALECLLCVQPILC